MPRAIIAALLLSSCDGWITGTEMRDTVALTLTRDNGNLTCASPAACSELPYTGVCAALEIEVDIGNGRTCQRCVRDDGSTEDQGCADGVVGCVLVTLPDPDCVVCAYVDGTVVYSTCRPEEPAECVAGTTVGDTRCERCFDPTGRVVFNSCVPDCTDVVCLPTDCAAGSKPWRAPGECCDRCVPVEECRELVCPLDYPTPECPDNSRLVRDPTDCCRYLCLPNECPTVPDGLDDPVPCEGHADCPDFTLCVAGFCEYDGTEACPPGSEWADDYPHCGQCVLGADERLCADEEGCLEGEVCAYIEGTCEVDAADSTTCYGVCLPRERECHGDDWNPELAPCEGGWLVEYDEANCPVPICVCFDGSLSLDGICPDQCAAADCSEVPPPECGAGFNLEHIHPHCCGVCVPEDLCAYLEGLVEPPPDVPVLACPEVACAPGFHEEADPETCCPSCVPDIEGLCTSSYNCGTGTYCTVEDGACEPPPGCESDGCATVCYGRCDPREIPVECHDSDLGISPHVAGMVTLQQGEETSVFWDRCAEEDNAVVEMYCSDTGPQLRDAFIHCPPTTECVEGACVGP